MKCLVWVPFHIKIYLNILRENVFDLETVKKENFSTGLEPGLMFSELYCMPDSPLKH